MCIGIIRNNSSVGGCAGAEAQTSATEHIMLYCTWQLSALTSRPHGQINICGRDVNRVPGPRDPIKLPDPGFQTTRKLPLRPLPHSETTGLPAQQGQSRHCSVLSETVTTVSLRRSHLVNPRQSRTFDAGQTSVTSRHRPCAGQSRLLRLVISPWLRV